MARTLAIAFVGLAFWNIPLAQGGDIAPATEKPVETGVVSFHAVSDGSPVPARYQLSDHTFPYELKFRRRLPGCGVDILRLTYPSPVTSPCPENNTVYAEYYRPDAPGKVPGVIILDITGGDQSLSRTIATFLAENKIAGLFVQMAYYGPRRAPGSSRRLLSPNFQETFDAVRQTVLDLRRAAAWLAARPEIDADRLAILGTSLGSFMSALTGEMEPRLKRVVVLLGGGGFVDAYYDHPEAAPYRKLWEALGGSKEKLKHVIAPVDPLSCAANLKNRRLLIIAGKRDDIVPPSASVALWEASGKQKIVWFDCTHYGAASYFLPAMREVIAHLTAE